MTSVETVPYVVEGKQSQSYPAESMILGSSIRYANLE